MAPGQNAYLGYRANVHAKEPQSLPRRCKGVLGGGAECCGGSVVEMTDDGKRFKILAFCGRQPHPSPMIPKLVSAANQCLAFSSIMSRRRPHHPRRRCSSLRMLDGTFVFISRLGSCPGLALRKHVIRRECAEHFTSDDLKGSTTCGSIGLMMKRRRRRLSTTLVSLLRHGETQYPIQQFPSSKGMNRSARHGLIPMSPDRLGSSPSIVARLGHHHVHARPIIPPLLWAPCDPGA